MTTQLTIMIWGLLGAVAYRLANYKIKGTKSKFSPATFDPIYWISDVGNWSDMALGSILFYIIAVYKELLFKTYPDFVLVKWLLPFKDEFLLYFLLGLFMTYIIKLFRNLVVFVGKSLSTIGTTFGKNKN